MRDPHHHRDHGDDRDGFEKRPGRERGGRGPRVFAPGDLKLLLPALIAEQSKDRYVPGDDYRYMTLNVRLANELSSNFEMQYELSWQTMDLDALGYDGRQSANGDYWKFTFAPTFKARTGDFFIRPELRLFATYMNWSRDLDSFSATDDFGQKGFKSGGNWQLAIGCTDGDLVLTMPKWLTGAASTLACSHRRPHRSHNRQVRQKRFTPWTRGSTRYASSST